ncbi:hypothetical protein SAMN04488595_102447 [Ralstonia sp. 25mfcol4.1]|uniref:hypothetical protein n=1 Tax=Ralstonia sp. 25mfcol4.1 TaxID=1761899 RepID=UPI00048D54E2|nr:hypothetical protein [Ralstonia sp. 25mfcol4.1]SDO83384.1 hypothetical protein SAMN04488595_102447 [Ralstonia sp. 25mfcol4.1]
MSPTSEDLEDFHDKVKKMDLVLSKLGTTEVNRSEILTGLASLAKDWLRVASELRNTADGYLPSLDPYDKAMAEVLSLTKQRTRVSTFRARLKPFVGNLLDDVVVPLMRFEGSPSQAAARQLQELFATSVSQEEMAYVQEAARCSSVHAHRAAIIMLWAAGVARLHNQIQLVGFAAFNAAAAAASAKKGAPYNRITKGLTVNSVAELQRSRDADILAVGMELWLYDLQAFEEQDRLLSIRNSAAHPGMFMPVALDVRQFAEKLRRYIFDLVK